MPAFASVVLGLKSTGLEWQARHHCGFWHRCIDERGSAFSFGEVLKVHTAFMGIAQVNCFQHLNFLLLKTLDKESAT